MAGVGQYRWESKDSWHNPGLHNATFLVIDTTNPRNASYATASEARATFGPSTAVTETVYRQQIRPVIVGGAEAMDRIFRESATAPKPIVTTQLVTQRPVP